MGSMNQGLESVVTVGADISGAELTVGAEVTVAVTTGCVTTMGDETVETWVEMMAQ
jgi:hypothetical protein